METETGRPIGFLHARGGVSDEGTGASAWKPGFLHARGGVSDELLTSDIPGFCFLHARGGVSDPAAGDHNFSSFSPRTWRCFVPPPAKGSNTIVFSTHVEVFLLRRTRSAL